MIINYYYNHDSPSINHPLTMINHQCHSPIIIEDAPIPSDSPMIRMIPESYGSR